MKRSRADDLVTVVIPARDRSGLLNAQLEAIASQAYDGAWELVIADNGSSGDVLAAARCMANRFQTLRIIDARSSRNAGEVRNVGAAAGNGGRLLFTDADDIVMPGWLAALATSLKHHDFVTGPVRYVDFDFEPPAIPTVVAEQPGPPRHLGVIPFAHASNFGVTRSAFDAVSRFDVGVAYGEDIDLALRLDRAGFHLHWEPGARLLVRRRADLRSVAAQHFRFGRGSAQLLRRHRAYLPPRTRWAVWRAYLATPATAYRLLSPRRRLLWVQHASACAGRVVGSLTAPARTS